LQQRAYPEAETHLKAALQQDPDFILARENLARCYLEQGKFAESRKLLNRLIRDYPQETRYRMALQAIP
jgi:predicted Zn-dependent protease